MGLFMKIGPRPGQSSTNTDIKSTDLPKLPGATAQEVEFYSSTLSEDVSLEAPRSLDGSAGFENEYTAAVPSRLRESQTHPKLPAVDQQSWGVMDDIVSSYHPGGQHLSREPAVRAQVQGQHVKQIHSDRYQPKWNEHETASSSDFDQPKSLCDVIEQEKAALEIRLNKKREILDEKIRVHIKNMRSDVSQMPECEDLQKILDRLHEQAFAEFTVTDSRRGSIKPATVTDLLATVSAAGTTIKFEGSIIRLSRKFSGDVIGLCVNEESALPFLDDLILLYNSIAFPKKNAFDLSITNMIDDFREINLIQGTKNLGLETVERLVNGGRPESLTEVYCFLAVCFAMSQCEIAPQSAPDRPQVRAGIRMLRRCIYVPHNREATNNQRKLFDIITEVLFEEFECALNWLKLNGPEGILERLDQSTGFSGAMEDILNRRSKDRVPPDLSHSGSTFRACAKQKPPEAIDDDDLGPPSWLELSVLPVVQVLNDIATTLQDIGLGFFCFIALLCPALVIQTSSGWGGAAKHNPTTSSIIPQAEVIGTPSSIAPFPSPSPSVYMPVPASWDDAPAEMDEMDHLPFVEPIADVQALYQTRTESFAFDPLSLISPTDVESGTIPSDSLATNDTSGSTTPGNNKTPPTDSPSTSSSQSQPRATRPNNGHIVCTHPGCTKRFKHKNNLYRHRKTHHASNDHSGASSSSSSSAVSKPPQDQKWQCLFCKAKRGTARGRENIEQHMKDEHAQELERYKRGLLGQSLMFYAGMSQG